MVNQLTCCLNVSDLILCVFYACSVDSTVCITLISTNLCVCVGLLNVSVFFHLKLELLFFLALSTVFTLLTRQSAIWLDGDGAINIVFLRLYCFSLSLPLPPPLAPPRPTPPHPTPTPTPLLTPTTTACRGLRPVLRFRLPAEQHHPRWTGRVQGAWQKGRGHPPVPLRRGVRGGGGGGP